MKNIDYKIFVPRGENNHVRFDGEQIEITDLLTINIHFADDKVVYWLYFKIEESDFHHKALLRKGSHPNMVLLIGNNPYEIYGIAEIIDVSCMVWESKILYTVSYTVLNASKTVNNPRKEVKVKRTEMLDLREIEG